MVLPCYFIAPVTPQVPTELKATDCAFVSVQMEKTLDVALLDTGAAYSILRASYSALVDATLESKLTLAAANGSHIRVYGRARVSIKIGIKIVVHVFYVADVVHNILGADLIKAHDIVISLASNKVTIQGQEVAIVNMAIPMPRCRCQCHDQPGVAATVDTLYPGQTYQAPQVQHPPYVSETDVHTPTYIYPTVFPEPTMVPGPDHTFITNNQNQPVSYNSQPTYNNQPVSYNSQPMYNNQPMTYNEDVANQLMYQPFYQPQMGVPHMVDAAVGTTNLPYEYYIPNDAATQYEPPSDVSLILPTSARCVEDGVNVVNQPGQPPRRVNQPTQSPKRVTFHDPVVQQ